MRISTFAAVTILPAFLFAMGLSVATSSAQVSKKQPQTQSGKRSQGLMSGSSTSATEESLNWNRESGIRQGSTASMAYARWARRINADASRFFGVVSNHEGASKGPGSFLDMQELSAPNSSYQYSFPSVEALSNGDLVMAYTDSGPFPTYLWNSPLPQVVRLYIVRSTDGGTNWSVPQAIAEGTYPFDFNFLRLTRTGSGRLLLAEFTDYGDHRTYHSDDGGVTWTSASIAQFPLANVHGPIAGNVWHTYGDPATGSAMYRTSANGVAWGAGKVLLANNNASRYVLYVGGIADGEEAGYVVATVEQYDFETDAVTTFVMRSTNGGTTWSQIGVLPTNGLELSVNTMKSDSDGALWIVAQGHAPVSETEFDPFAYFNDVYYLKSSNSGTSWTDPVAFTRYIGEDMFGDVAFTNDGPIVVFQSDRVQPGKIFYGIAGKTSDAAAPAAFQIWDFPLGGISANESASVIIAASAASGLSSVDVLLTVDGVESVIPLIKGGPDCSNYLIPDALCWGGTLGPFPAGLEISAELRAVDNDSRLTIVSLGEISVFWGQDHNVGNMDVTIWNSGFLDRVIWPSGGENYMCCGGPWFGSSATGTIIEEYMWSPSPEFNPTSGPGKSDQDISVSYDDAGVLGVSIVQTSFQWSGAVLRNGIVFEYAYTNTGAAGDLGQVFAGLNLDADITQDLFFDDLIAFSPENNLIYMHDSGVDCMLQSVSCPRGYLGLAILKDASGVAPKQAAVLPHTATWNFYDDNLFNIMTSGINPALAPGAPQDPNDYIMLLTAQPFELPVGVTKTVTFALVMGESLQDLAATVSALGTTYEAGVTGIEPESAAGVPMMFALQQNYPNPFNPSTTIRFDVPITSKVTLAVFDMLGRRVVTLVDGVVAAGTYSAPFDANSLPSGAYVYRLDTPSSSFSKSMILLR